MGKMVLIDGNSLASRAFYALPLLNNKQGIYTNAVYGFTQIILKIIDEIKPTHIMVAFDAGKITFRHTDFAEYKGKRLKTPSELSSQFPLIKEVLEAFKIKYFELEGYEADDIIGTMSKEAQAKGMGTIIYTGDKDMLQLSSEEIAIYLTRKGITEVEIYHPEQIMEKYGLTPGQIVDLKGLMGDTSDNIPGVPGIGEKTALKLLHEYGSVENVLQNIDKISGKKLQENLTVYQEQALLSKQLATIYKDVPMNIAIDDIRYNQYDQNKLYTLFNNLEFNSLIDRLNMAEAPVEDTISQITFQTFSQENALSWNEKFKSKKTIALHIEGEKQVLFNHNILGISLSDGNEHLYLTFEEVQNWEQLKEWLKDDKAPKWVYDSKYSELELFWNNIELQGVTFDLLLGNYLLNPSDGTVSLSDIARFFKYSGLQSDELIYGKGAKWSIPTKETLAEHICKKAHAIMEITPKVKANLIESDLIKLLEEIELPLAKILSEMEKTGVKVDKDYLKQMGVEINDTLADITKQIFELAGAEFNINSPKQLGEILFDKLQLPIIKKTKTGYSTDADVLDKLEPYHPIISKILNYRQLGKLYSTYIEGLLKMVRPDTQKIHTSFNQAITATGRLSSTEPNLQNIPIRLEEGRKIRHAFIPSEKDWLILSADYSQIELRVLAHIANDENLIKAFNNDLDIHTKTAVDVFGVKAEEVTSLMRRQAKAVNFGIVYGISDYGLSQNLNISRKEAAIFIEKYFEVFSGVKNYMRVVVEQAKKDGYVTTMLNRRRYLPDLNNPNYNIRSFAERTAINTPIQGTAADIIKIAMINVKSRIKAENLQSRLLLQVHDELIFEVPETELDRIKQIVIETMENSLKLNVPLKVDINEGKTWYEAK